MRFWTYGTDVISIPTAASVDTVATENTRSSYKNLLSEFRYSLYPFFLSQYHRVDIFFIDRLGSPVLTRRNPQSSPSSTMNPYFSSLHICRFVYLTILYFGGVFPILNIQYCIFIVGLTLIFNSFHFQISNSIFFLSR